MWRRKSEWEVRVGVKWCSENGHGGDGNTRETEDGEPSKGDREQCQREGKWGRKGGDELLVKNINGEAACAVSKGVLQSLKSSLRGKTKYQASAISWGEWGNVRRGGKMRSVF